MHILLHDTLDMSKKKLYYSHIRSKGHVVRLGFETSLTQVGQTESPTCQDSAVKIGELFCGAGGMALGASQAEYNGWKFEHAWVTDIDRDSCETIKQVVNYKKVVRKDVKDIDFNDWKRKYGSIDGLVFGFPCNDFSVVGERRGIDGEFGGLYKFGVKAIHELRPTFFVAENVSGLSSINRRADFDKILTELRAAGSGYKVVENLYKFEEYGVPQRRHRYIIIGFKADTGIEFVHPKPDPMYKVKTARDALSELSDDAPNNERTMQSRQVVERLSHIKPGENAFTANLPKKLRLNMRSGAKISQIYRRLRPDEPSYTVTGSGGGGTHLYHWDEPRALTNRERARLQSFPDNYVFEGGKESVRRQIGMAVPPEGARIVFNAVLATIADHFQNN